MNFDLHPRQSIRKIILDRLHCLGLERSHLLQLDAEELPDIKKKTLERLSLYKTKYHKCPSNFWKHKSWLSLKHELIRDAKVYYLHQKYNLEKLREVEKEIEIIIDFLNGF